MNDIIKNMLIGLGINPVYAGFRYLVEAILVTIDKLESEPEMTTRDLQMEVANRTGQNIWNVERRTRSIINIAFENPKDELLELFRPYLNKRTGTVGTKCFARVIAIKCIAERSMNEQ